MLDSSVFENFVLVDQPFAKALQIPEAVYQLIITYVEKWKISFIIRISNQI